MAELCSSVALSQGGSVIMVIDTPDDAVQGEAPVLVLAHGAGNDCRSPFMEYFASSLSAIGLVVVRFNFPYKERGGTRPPDKMPVLVDAMRNVCAAQSRRTGAPPGPIFVGGKSMGARVAATMVAEGLVRPSGLVFLGYPLHKPGEATTTRADNLAAVRRPILFLQGTRDPFCNLPLLRRVRKDGKLAGALVEIEGGGHSFEFAASKRSEQTAALEGAVATIQQFVKRVLERRAS